MRSYLRFTLLPMVALSAAYLAIGSAGCSDSNSTTTNPDAATVLTTDASVPDTSTASSSCAGRTKCGDICVDATSDLSNCGTCGTKCAAGQVCSQGQCALACGGGTTKCGDTCRDTQADPANCGACGTKCAAGQVCSAGTCKLSCPATSTACGGGCIDPNTSPQFCGATAGCGAADAGSAGTACASSAHGSGVCVGGQCKQTCATGYGGATCSTCTAGFQDNDSNGTCLAACTASTCANAGTCSDTSGTATCTCRPGFMGSTCGTACAANKAGDACDYSLVYGLDIPVGGDWNTPADVPYGTDNSAAFVGVAFTRVAYRLILDTTEVWTEMDAFTADPTQLGVPVDAVFQTAVTNVLVKSFSSNLGQTTAPANGNIEFWSDCYNTTGGNNALYDYSDTRAGGTDCYGSMQVFVNQSTVFGFNRWSNNSTPWDMGIGPQPTGQPDWTFAVNANQFTTRRLEVYVK